MKILTKIICSDKAFDGPVGSIARRPKRLAGKGALVAGALGLAIALTACGGSPTSSSATSSPTEPVDSTTAAEAPATSESTTADNQTYTEDGVAISGADPVAYFTEEAYVPGSADYTYDWNGVTWQFASAENRDLFAANPEQYAPEYGGFCAWAVAAKEALVPTDPNAWSVVDGKLYLNANQKVQSNWEKDIAGFIAKANNIWPRLSQS